MSRSSAARQELHLQARASGLDEHRAPTPAPVRTRRINLLIGFAFLLAALAMTNGLWAAPATRVVANNSSDQFFFEWVLTYTAHAITHGTNPFFTPLMNAPLGVNIASNTSITAVGVVLAPVTLLFGPAFTFVITLTLGLASTAYAWYWLLQRHAGLSRGASVFAGAFCGFAPGIMSHANAHVNFTAQFLLPILLWRLIRLTRSTSRRPRAILRDGTILGLLIAIQYSIGAELLFFTGIGVAIYAIAWSLPRPRVAARIARRVTPRLAIAVLVAAGFLAYPVWMQFFGPQAYDGTGFGGIGATENLLSFGAYPFDSLAGHLGAWAKLTANVAEENTFFGPILVALAAICAIRQSRRRPGRTSSRLLRPEHARALSITAVAIAVLSLGPALRVADVTTSMPLPWALLSRLPLFSAALPGRFALLLTPIIGYLLAVSLDEFRTARSTMPAAVRRNRTRVVAIVAALAIVPILPLPIATGARSTLPHFFTSGEWRRYIPAGRTVVSVAPSTTTSPDAQRWQTATDFAFPIDGGYFLGPGADGHSHVGPVPTATYTLLKSVSSTGVGAFVTNANRAQARADLAYWNAGLIVLPDPTAGIGDEWTKNFGVLKNLATALFGPGRHVDDVWIWSPQR